MTPRLLSQSRSCFAPKSGRISRNACVPVRRLPTAVRVSRGVSALGATVSFRLGPTRPGGLATVPRGGIRDTSDPFLLPYTPSTSTRTPSGSGPSSPTLRGACTRRGAAHRDRRSRVSRRADRFGVPLGLAWGRVSPYPRAAAMTASDIPVANHPRCRGAHFRGARDPTRRGPPRPLPPRRRDSAKLFPVRDAFVRRETRCSSSGLSTGDCAPDPGLEAQRRLQGRRSTRVVPRPTHAVLRTPRIGHRLRVASGSLHHEWLRSEELRTRSVRPRGAGHDHDDFIRRPGPRSPRPPSPFRVTA